ncbi:hypothetical protein TNIN_443001 [Trichonephila inaurata madagascariensis]|uniref:Uncharacterized protein n=1 Tax=Trichonephila inaurata madagascariensis TaxID=2747483 RepID=A0A8X6WLF4_9ARAC|nr:hypothetical protein TNIN_443001 [Trichonephila inaurata madagascariensis]
MITSMAGTFKNWKKGDKKKYCIHLNIFRRRFHFTFLSEFKVENIRNPPRSISILFVTSFLSCGYFGLRVHGPLPYPGGVSTRFDTLSSLIEGIISGFPRVKEKFLGVSSSLLWFFFALVGGNSSLDWLVFYSFYPLDTFAFVEIDLQGLSGEERLENTL